MTKRLRTALGLAAGLAVLTMASVGQAATTVNVSLWDSGPAAQDMLNMMAEMQPDMMMGMAMPAAQDMSMATLGVTADITEVKAGEVTFQVTNDSTEIMHEMIVAPVGASGGLPYSEADFRVDEEAIGHLGEVSELDPGATGALTVTLTPGTYVLFCNLPGHYMMGMWTTITVTE